MLPSSIIPMFVDLQGPLSQAADHARFLYNLSRKMAASAKHQRGLILPIPSQGEFISDPFTCFDEWLDIVERHLGKNIALLTLDEIEALNIAFSQSRFSENHILGMLRNLIQHRSQFKVLLAGSHSIQEFRSWAGYLINVRVMKISYLKEDEALKLIEHPVKTFTAFYEPGASQRVLELTRGHPALIQLLCYSIISLKNEQPAQKRNQITLGDVEQAVPEALERGTALYFTAIENQFNNKELALLHFLATQGERSAINHDALKRSFPEELNQLLELPMKRDVIERTSQGYRFQVELLRRWFMASAPESYKVD